jgi:hypothetical protein
MRTRDPSTEAPAPAREPGRPGPAAKRSGSRGLTCLVVVVVVVVLAPTIAWYAASRGLWWEVRATPMQVSNFTGVDLVIIHRAENGNETTLTDYEVITALAPSRRWPAEVEPGWLSGLLAGDKVAAVGDEPAIPVRGCPADRAAVAPRTQHRLANSHVSPTRVSTDSDFVT